jgi:hypothetical protein
LLGSPPMWCWSIRMGWAGWAWHEGLSPTGPTHGRRPDRAGTRPASPDRRAGRGVHGARELARGTAVDPGPGGRLDAGELFAWVDGSSVSLTCSYADQGGCHVDMVVGADHRGRSRIAVWRDTGPPSPLTARRHQSARSQLALFSTRPTAWRRGRCLQAQRAQPTPSVARPAGSGTSPGTASPSRAPTRGRLAVAT